MTRRTSTHTLTLTSLMTALLCIAGPLTIPAGPVPVSLTAALLMLTALLLGPGRALACCGAYLLMGCVGLPVFSGFTGGVGQLLSPTGGYLLGYLPLTAIGGYVCAHADRKWLQALGFAAGMAALYALGTAWYCRQSGAGLTAALAVCVWPFLPIDGAKILLALTFGGSLRARLQRAGLLR